MPQRTRVPLSGFIAPILAEAFENGELSQAQLGQRADVSQSQVSKYFRGVRVPDVDVLDDLCSALGLDVAEVVAEAKRQRGVR